MCRHLFALLFSIPYTRSRTAGHMVILFDFLTNCQTSFHGTWPFYILTSNVWGFSFSHPCQPWLFSDCFPQIFATLVDMECYLTMVLICIDDFLCLLAICMEKYLFKSFSHFSRLFIFGLLNFKSCLCCRSWTLTRYIIFKCFPSFHRLFLYFLDKISGCKSF